MKIVCSGCGAPNVFDQRHRYHAGFSNVGFLYDNPGTCTLIWSTFDPAYTAVVGEAHPWMLDETQRHLLEARLRPSPSGGRWRFKNVPRCVHCQAGIGKSITQDIYYYVYPGSVNTEKSGVMGFAKVLREEG